jgi:hypothetical protein
LFFNDDSLADDGIVETVTQQQPRPVTPTIKPLDEKPKTSRVERVEDDEAEDEAPVVAAANPTDEEPRARDKTRRTRRGGGGGGGVARSLGGRSGNGGGGSFNKARAAVVACGRQHGAIEGTVISVSFDIVDGGATNVQVAKPHSVTSLGRCVANAVRSKARFGLQNAPGQTRRVQL